MKLLRAVLLAISCVIATLSPQTVLAEADATVEPLIQEGIELRKSHQDEAALKVFLQAETRAPNDVRLLLHITTAAQAAGKWILAHQYMRRVSHSSNDPYYVRHEAAIATVVEAINRKVGELKVEGSPTGAEVLLNGTPIGTVPFVEPRPVEVGSYTMEVTKPGYYKLRRPLDITGGVLTREVVSLNQRPTGDASAAGVAPGHSPRDGERETTASPWSASWVRWTLGGLAVASAGVGGVALYLRENRVQEWNDNSTCIDAGRTDRTRQSECGDVRTSAKSLETVSVVAGVAAVAFGGAALAHWLATEPSSEPPGEQTARVVCSPGVLALSCAGTF